MAVPATAAADDNDATQLCSSSSLQADSPATISTFQWDDFDKFSWANFQPLPQPFTWDDFYKEFPNVTDNDAAWSPHNQSTTLMSLILITTSSTQSPESEEAAGQEAQPIQPKLHPYGNTHPPAQTTLLTMPTPNNSYPSAPPPRFNKIFNQMADHNEMLANHNAKMLDARNPTETHDGCTTTRNRSAKSTGATLPMQATPDTTTTQQ